MARLPPARRERDDVSLDARNAADESVRPDAHELVHARSAADRRVIADFDVAAEQYVIGEDDAFAQLAIMRNMRICEQSASRADTRPGADARIDGDALANDAVFADVDAPSASAAFRSCDGPPTEVKGKMRARDPIRVRPPITT